MILLEVTPIENGILRIVANNGRSGVFDVRPYLSAPAFQSLSEWNEFKEVRNAGYYIEWRCGADLSADTIEAKWVLDCDLGEQQSAALKAWPEHCKQTLSLNNQNLRTDNHIHNS